MGCMLANPRQRNRLYCPCVNFLLNDDDDDVVDCGCSSPRADKELVRSQSLFRKLTADAVT